MAKAPKKRKRNIENYAHRDKERANNPPVGLVTPETDKDAGRKTYAHDPHIDPQLSWAGKAEHTAFEVSTVSLHVHERIDPRTVVEAVRKRNGASFQSQGFQGSLFDDPEENPPIRQAIDFYRHRHNWTNRLVAGDSLLVMNSLLEKEGLGGQVQMVYVDPPYGIRYGSNFQPFVNRQDVTDGRDEDLTSEPETIRAFRDTWELGIHSYLTYLRDRLLLARELLHESGSCFVQIGKENVHRAGCGDGRDLRCGEPGGDHLLRDHRGQFDQYLAGGCRLSAVVRQGSAACEIPAVVRTTDAGRGDRVFSVGTSWSNCPTDNAASRLPRNVSIRTDICRRTRASTSACPFPRPAFQRPTAPSLTSGTAVSFLALPVSIGGFPRRGWTGFPI